MCVCVCYLAEERLVEAEQHGRAEDGGDLEFRAALRAEAPPRLGAAHRQVPAEQRARASRDVITCRETHIPQHASRSSGNTQPGSHRVKQIGKDLKELNISEEESRETAEKLWKTLERVHTGRNVDTNC